MSGTPLPEQGNGPMMLDLKSAASYTGLPFWSLRDLVVSGRIPRVTLPNRDGKQQRRIWVLRKDLDEYFFRRRERNIEPGQDSGNDSGTTRTRNIKGNRP